LTKPTEIGKFGIRVKSYLPPAADRTAETIFGGAGDRREERITSRDGGFFSVEKV
jgi:hypothetical protein